MKKHLEQFVDSKVDGLILDLRSNGEAGWMKQSPWQVCSSAEIRGGRQAIRRTPCHRSPQPGENDFRKSRPFDAQPLQRFRIGDPGRGASGLPTGDPGGDLDHFGKGTVQNIVQLPEGFGALKVTIAQFYRVSGGSTQNKGVESNIIFSFREQCPGHQNRS